MQTIEQDQVRASVRERYGAVAKAGAGAGCAPSGGCCSSPVTATDATRLGYSAADAQAVPEGADMGLGCGNPIAIASIQPGEAVLDLGSGGGFDAFLAAPRVGPTGKVIGVDMTPEMISKARANAAKGGFTNVEFRLGEIEHLPLADNSVDLIISNCVINLSPDKPQVFREALRVLKSGGRLAISDVVATAVMPEALRKDLAAYTGCVAGAALVDDLQAMLVSAGFTNVRIQPKDTSREFIREWMPGSSASDYVVSAVIEATKP
jgi:arsenite methyltransferase